jgi:hypothetical protein
MYSLHEYMDIVQKNNKVFVKKIISCNKDKWCIITFDRKYQHMFVILHKSRPIILCKLIVILVPSVIFLKHILIFISWIKIHIYMINFFKHLVNHYHTLTSKSSIGDNKFSWNVRGGDVIILNSMPFHSLFPKYLIVVFMQNPSPT